MDWLTPVEVVTDAYWPSCPLVPADEVDAKALDRLLTSARIQCEEFAPTLAEGADVPENWRLAQAFQARALYRSARAGSQDRLGEDGLAVTVFPMDWTVKNLLRPKRGKFVVR
ncbi:hypothetical protein EXU48_15680 [Occultella glacieicola]|uniref:Head-to-tail adaptor n=1 Tax=Occultella glacieicola TaxID=2518684 RepID=A0ABY2E0Y6_9MICO|nr:hypothetical protein [Occultella glacieicola]TDE91585.1 hypothetical protein EXU48_15680 [Occultella glacieicola]